jgi:hypothetical protein
LFWLHWHCTSNKSEGKRNQAWRSFQKSSWRSWRRRSSNLFFLWPTLASSLVRVHCCVLFITHFISESLCSCSNTNI